MLNLLVNFEEGYVAVERKVEDMAVGALEWFKEEMPNWKVVTLEEGIADLEKKDAGEFDDWREKKQEFIDAVKGKKGRFLLWWCDEMNDGNVMFQEQGETI